MIKIKLTDPNAKCPRRANPTDAGADLISPISTKILPYCHEFIDLGFQMEIPEGYTALIIARSGLGVKGIRPRNCVGVIDSKYRGNVGLMLENNNDIMCRISKGDRLAQMLIVPVSLEEYIEVDELNMAEDRGGGFGHTGK